MFFGDRSQNTYASEVQRRMNERAASEQRYRKDELRQQRLAFMRSAITSAVAAAPAGLFEGIRVEEAAAAAVRAGMGE